MITVKETKEKTFTIIFHDIYLLVGNYLNSEKFKNTSIAFGNIKKMVFTNYCLILFISVD